MRGVSVHERKRTRALLNVPLNPSKTLHAHVVWGGASPKVDLSVVRSAGALGNMVMERMVTWDNALHETDREHGNVLFETSVRLRIPADHRTTVQPHLKVRGRVHGA
uniref:Uncharacterized protein n=1 Tax=Haptolina brevifila TaxID=156173 RepID=A0A7S2D2T3_9EUKA|mmetsp:Transcript_32267/g.64368  ORF Transcript_32267/g.64368 Transcript_32267/m.64368 type:complete len:107 (+) Transcript_32267:193-513(+)